MSENLTWLAVGLITAGYISQRRAAVAKREPVTVQLSADNEVDPTRWKHDGGQPPTYGSYGGNRIGERDAQVLLLRNALAF